MLDLLFVSCNWRPFIAGGVCSVLEGHSSSTYDHQRYQLYTAVFTTSKYYVIDSVNTVRRALI